MNPTRRDIDDFDDDMFNRDEVQDRAAKRQEAIERNARLAEHEAEQDAKRIAAASERVRHARGRELMNEYRAAGIEPAHVDADGYPTTSLSLVRKIRGVG